LVLISGLLPFSIKFYWRFIPFLVLAGIAGWIAFFKVNRRRYAYLLLTMLIVLGIYNVKIKMNVFAEWKPYLYQQDYFQGEKISYDILKTIPADETIFADEIESHILSGLTGHNVVGVRPQHASFRQLPEQKEGYHDIQKAYANPSYLKEVISKYSVDYILLKKSPVSDRARLLIYTRENFSLVKSDEYFELFKAAAN